MQAAPVADALQLGEYIGCTGVAHRISGGTDVEAEGTATRHDIDRAVGHMEHAHRGHEVGLRAAALFDENDEFSRSSRSIAAAIHRRGAGVAGHAHDFANIAHAAIDRCDDAQRQVHLVQYRPLLDMHFNEAEVLRCIAFQLGNIVDSETRMHHGLA